MHTTIHTTLKNLSDLDKIILDAIMHEYCSYMRIRYKNINSSNPQNEKDFRNSQEKILVKNKEKTRMDRRYGRSIDEEIHARIDSLIECRKDELKLKEYKLNDLSAKITKIKEKYDNSIQNNLNVFSQSTLNSLKKLYQKRDKLFSRIDFLNQEIENPRLCFGGSKLFKEQFKAHVNHKEWKRKWRTKRNDFFYLSGAKHEACGNQVMQLSIGTDPHLFNLKITLPVALQEKYGKHFVLRDINIKTANELRYLVNQLAQYKKDKKSNSKIENNCKPLTFMVKKKKNEYRLHISYELKKDEVVTNSVNGVVAVDINPENLSFTEINQFGNRLFSKVVHLDFKDHGTGFREAQINRAVNEILDYAKEKGKDIVLENLDFSEKKKQVVSITKNDKKYNKMLHSFAYAKTVNRFERNALIKGVVVHKVNPAYTSLVGAIKYAKTHGISIHEAASYAIARKFYNFKEKLKSPLVELIIKAKVYRVEIPEDIMRLQYKNETKFLKSLYTWYQNKCKQIFKNMKKEPILTESG